MSVDQIIKDFKKELYGFVLKRIKDENIAKDIHQDILIKIFANHKSLKKKGSLKSWIYQIARNSITDYYRRNKIPTEDVSPHLTTNESEPTQEDALLPCIKPFLEQLRPNYKEALEFTELGNHTQKELAEKLNISYSGAKSTVQRARHQLKEIFSQCCKIEVDKYGSILDVSRSANCTCP